MHLLDPDAFELTYEQEDRLENLRKIWGIMTKHLSTMKRVKLIMREMDVSRRTVFRMMEDAQYLFGDIMKTTAEEELAIMKEKYYRLADRAEKDGDFDTARRCMDSAREIIQKLDDLKPKKQDAFLSIEFTSDPKALTAHAHDTEDADFEEIPEASLLERQTADVSAGSAAD